MAGLTAKTLSLDVSSCGFPAATSVLIVLRRSTSADSFSVIPTDFKVTIDLLTDVTTKLIASTYGSVYEISLFDQDRKVLSRFFIEMPDADALLSGLVKLTSWPSDGRPITLSQLNLRIAAEEQARQQHEDDLLNPHQTTAEQLGLGNVDNTSDEDKPVSIATQTVVDNLDQRIATEEQARQQHEDDLENPHQVTAEQIGLGNVNNTSDANKPVSAATQTAIDNLNEQLTSDIIAVGNDSIGRDNNLTSQLQAEATERQEQDSILSDSISALANGATRAYLTYAALDAAKATLPANSFARVTNDPTPANNWLWQWNGTVLTKSARDDLAQATAYVDANPLFLPVDLSLNADLNLLPTGIYYVRTAEVAASLLNAPTGTSPMAGTIVVYRRLSTAYQRFIRYNTLDVWERVGNGGSGSFAWLAWVKVVNRDEYNANNLALDASIKAWVSANPLFSPVILQANASLNTVGTGYFIIPSGTVGATITDNPWVYSPQGHINSINESKANYQIAYPADVFNKVRERFGNGRASTDPLFAWLPWQDVVSMTDITTVKALIDTKPTLNLFPNPALTSAQSTIYQGTSSVVDGFNVLQLNAGSLSVAYYDIDINDTTMRVGDTLTVTIDGYTSETPFGFELALAYLNSSAGLIGSLKRTFNTVINAWEAVTSTTVVPAGAVKLQVRLLNRGVGANTKFRKPVLTSNAYAAKFITPSVSAGATTVYVAKTGSDINLGTNALPFLTISKAVATLPNGGNVVVLDSGDYRETVAVTSFGHVKISASAGNRVNIFGSDRLVVTKTAGFTKVYQAPLAAKPTGLGAPRGLPVIFEWGTKSKPIIESERHPLHRGLTHRLPYTEMFESATKAELDTVNGKWFWESGIIYFSATDGGDATLKRYEVRARPTLTHNNGTIELNRVSAWFSSAAGMRFNGLKTSRQGCTSYGSFRNGFDDNANLTLSHKDISGGNGNDGFNATLDGALLAQPEFNTRLEQVYFDPYGHDNGDDGLSCHYRSDSTIYGGLFECNTKADVVHVTGANCICYNTVSSKTRHGFYSATTPTGDTERVKTVFRCVSTVATANEYSYTAYDDSVMQCIDTKAVNPLTWGYWQSGAGALHATNAKYAGDPLKAKSGTVIVVNDSVLT